MPLRPALTTGQPFKPNDLDKLNILSV
ncbi:hypothetical protein CCACVL1_29372 [Corchorus capsularis]|uniref:Uncharacterized protein n=1 Tax=Corchorus capsularis TaxID=210143 RepID=A0A1R3G1Y0_COCAP|nr:hypothetical protein CCACVL1_29372 [Corchorus capsularis]